LITRPVLQFVRNGDHLGKKTLEFGKVIREQRLVLLNTSSSKALHQLGNGQVSQIKGFHGLSTPKRINACFPTRTRSSQLLPRKYSLGETLPKSEFGV